MRFLLGQLTPRLGEPLENLARIDRLLASRAVGLAVFPELFVSGYRAGDRLRALALSPGGGPLLELERIAAARNTWLVLGAPVAVPDRAGEVFNAVLLIGPDGSSRYQVKRYLPTYGPFEEGRIFTPAGRSDPLPLAGHPVGLAICYDAFFPEIFRELALKGSELFLVVSASPVTSRRLFEKVLPARAVENGCPVLYANRTGVEDGLVFGGGSGAWDVRGEPIALDRVAVPDGEPEEALLVGELDLAEAGRWRPFRPVLRDVTAHPP